MKKPKDYFIASVECLEMKSFRGDVMTKDGTRVWLAASGDWPQVSLNKENAEHFKSPEEIKSRAPAYDGMPWYYRFKPDTLRIFKIEHAKIMAPVWTPTEVEL